MATTRDAAVATGGEAGGETRALHLLQEASGRRLLAMHALIVVVLLATAQSYDGAIHSVSHWLVLGAYAVCSIGLALAERWQRTGADAGARFESDRAEGLAWAATILNAGVAVYVEVEHMLAGSVGGYDDATGIMSRMPAFLLLLQTGLSMRVWHTIAFSGVVILVWSATIGLAATGTDMMPLGPHIGLRQEVTGLLTFVAAALVVIDGIRRLRGALGTALRLEHERAQLARFVPDSVGVRLAREGGVGTVRQRHACLFLLDIRGFSAMSRERAQDEVVRALLDVRALTYAAVSEHGGIVDKYIGDGILAHFVAGQPEAQASGALAAALAIRPRLDTLNQQRRQQGVPPLAVTVVLHAGSVLAGVFDDGQRAEFTALGPAMNMLARLEARAKAADLALAVSEDVVRLLGSDLPQGWCAIRAGGPGGDPRQPLLFAIEAEAAAVA